MLWLWKAGNCNYFGIKCRRLQTEGCWYTRSTALVRLTPRTFHIGVESACYTRISFNNLIAYSALWSISSGVTACAVSAQTCSRPVGRRPQCSRCKMPWCNDTLSTSPFLRCAMSRWQQGLRLARQETGLVPYDCLPQGSLTGVCESQAIICLTLAYAVIYVLSTADHTGRMPRTAEGCTLSCPMWE